MKADKLNLKEEYSDRKKLLEVFLFWENFLYNGTDLNLF